MAQFTNVEYVMYYVDGFVMDMLGLHWGNTNIGIQIGGRPADTCL
jgi:hypothetical protein